MENDRLRDLARRPLLLAIMVLVHKKGNKLPQERITLYDKFAEAFFETYEPPKTEDAIGFEKELDKEYYKYRREILEAVAFSMQRRSSETSARLTLLNEAELHELR